MEEEKIVADRDTLKILAVDTRMDILKELKKGDRTLSDLSRILKMDKSTIMEHLTILAKAELVKRIQNPGKKFVFYALTEKGSNIFVEKQRALEIKESRILTLLLIAVVGILLIGGSGVYYYYKVSSLIKQTQASSLIKETPPLIVSLSSSPFSTEKTAELTLTITSNINKILPNVTAGIILPDGIELVSGNINWSGDIPANGSVKLNVVIKAAKKGEWVVKAYVKTMIDVAPYYTEDKLYIIACENVEVSKYPPESEDDWYEKGVAIAIPLATNNKMINSTVSFSSLPELNKEVTLTYTLVPSIDLPAEQTYITLIYPSKGFELISVEFPSGGEKYQSAGQLTWKGGVRKGEVFQIKAVIKPIKTGLGYIYGHLSVNPDGKTITAQISDVALLYVKVGRCYASVERMNVTQWTPP
jgi:DNA-binding transcriptional ArsR family regulator